MPSSHKHRKRGAPSHVAAAAEPALRPALRLSAGIEALLALALLGLAVWVVYGRAMHAPFIFDDKESILQEPSIVRLWPLVGDAATRGPLNPSKDFPASGRPLVNLSLAINYHFGRLDPLGYHVFNMVAHILSATVLWALLRRTLCLSYFAGRFDRAAGPLSLLTALVWAVHPLQTEAVEYVTQRTELMMGFCYLATLYASLRYFVASSAAMRATWLATATVVCALGMACKEVMVSAPVAVLLFERTFCAGSFRQALKRSWRLHLSLILSWGLLFALNYSGPRSHSAGFHLGTPAYVWWSTQAKVLVMYWKLAFWPYPLAIHYDIPYLETFSAAWPWVLPVALSGIAMLALAWKRSVVGFLGASTFLILAPTLVVPIPCEIAAERRMYLPLAGLVALVCVGAYSLTLRLARSLARNVDRTRVPRWPIWSTTICAFVVALISSVSSIHRLALYGDEITIWQDVVAHNPDDAFAHNNLGFAVAGKGRLQEASEYYAAALRLMPACVEAHNNKGKALAEMGQLREAQECFAVALRLKPDFARAQVNLANTLVSSGRPGQAIAHFEEALRLEPDFAEAHDNLGAALLSLGRPQEAIVQCTESLQLNPRYAEAYSHLGIALVNTGKPQEAIEQFEQALRLKPDYAEACANLAIAYGEMHQAADAIATAERALRLAASAGRSALAQQIEAWLADYRLSQR